MRFSHNALTSALLLGLGTVFVAACSAGDTSSSSSTSSPNETVTGVPAANAPHVTSRDEAGAPKFMWAGRSPNAAAIAGEARDVARAHLVNHASVLGISSRIAQNARLLHEQKMEGGASVVTFGQKVGDVTVFRTRSSVILDRKNNLVAISGNLRSAADNPSKLGKFSLAPEDALAKAYADRFGVTLSAGAIRETGMEADNEYHDYEVTTPKGAARIVRDTARVRKIYFPVKNTLVAAYHVEFTARAPGSTVNDGWLYAIAADDGRKLVKNSLTQFEKFTYRVWAEQGAASQNNIPMDSPLTDKTPLPASATPENSTEGPYIASSLVSVDGFNKNPMGTFDPWLASGATQTQGNNVDAYTDRNSQDDGTGDGFDEGIDIRATTTAANTFDRTYDVTKDPGSSQDQERAAVTQLFYNTNWLHDYWYDSGFDEKSGNAQTSNYGRGGKEGDPLHAEAQDGADVGLSDNANMDTPSDGKSPRMQMYIWDGPSTQSLSLTNGVVLADPANPFPFGATSFNVTADVVYADVADGCSAPTNVSGKIALIDRGTCAFTDKVKNAQTAGAVAVLVANNAAGPLFGSGTDATITIGGFFITQNDGAAIKAKLATGTVSATLKLAKGTTRDGDIDNTVVAHEWGHYLHHRLVDCGANQCNGMSEGWADFDALMMVIKAGDTVKGTTYGLAQYASASLSPSGPYFGIRRSPYSTDMNKDPFTFKMIRQMDDLSEIPETVPLNISTPDNTEAHNTGEIWAEMLFEGYANILDGVTATPPRFTFEQAKRRMADYVVAGMKATPVEPSFTDQRDAILAVTFAKDQQDFLALAQGFAKRGLGVGAVSPPIDSDTYNEAVEDNSMKGNLKFLDASLNDAVRSCDRDGFLDADEAGDVLIRVQNSGWLNLHNTKATVASTAPGVTFPKGTDVSELSIDPYGIVKMRVTIALDKSVAKMTFIPVTITLANPDSLNATVTGNIDNRANFDVSPASAIVDDVEAPTTTWTEVAGDKSVGQSMWSRIAKVDAMGNVVDPPDTEWLGRNAAEGPSDQSLVSPSLTVSATDSFKLSFTHKYAFENNPATQRNPAYYFDGGVIEISPDDGATWVDISTYADPSYPHVLNTNGPAGDPQGNPLEGRPAFSGEQDDYSTVSLDLGTALAGKTVKVRFRVGADANTGLKGWEIDNITFAGITNKPFASLVDDASVCMGVPVAVAGMPQTVTPGQTVVLDGSASSDPDNDPITFQWEQLDGTAVTLADPTNAAKTSFVAPDVTEPTPLLFRVTVADAKQAASDTVVITVTPPTDAGPQSDADVGSPGVPPTTDDGCSCRTVGSSTTSGAGAFATAIAGVLAFMTRGRKKKR